MHRKLIHLFKWLVFLLLPYRIGRRWAWFSLGYELAETAVVGYSLVLSDSLVMEQSSKIGHLNIIGGIQRVHMKAHSSIGRYNQIGGIGLTGKGTFPFALNRRPSLTLEAHAALTNAHYIDCSDAVDIGSFSIVAGRGSQILTHSIDLMSCEQRTGSVSVGSFCFVGSRALLLMGSRLPDYSVLAAGSVLTRAKSETHRLYAGAPAEARRLIASDYGFFKRVTGYVR